MLTLSEIKRFLKLDETDTSQDTLLTELEESAVSVFEGLTNRTWSGGVVTETFSGGDEISLYLSSVPDVSQPITVTYTYDTPRIEESSRYKVIGAELVHVWGWEGGYKNVQVSYTRIANVPADVKHAIRTLIGFYYSGIGQAGTIKSESIGGYSYTLSDVNQDITKVPGLSEIVSRYRYRNI